MRKPYKTRLSLKERQEQSTGTARRLASRLCVHVVSGRERQENSTSRTVLSKNVSSCPQFSL